MHASGARLGKHLRGFGGISPPYLAQKQSPAVRLALRLCGGKGFRFQLLGNNSHAYSHTYATSSPLYRRIYNPSLAASSLTALPSLARSTSSLPQRDIVQPFSMSQPLNRSVTPRERIEDLERPALDDRAYRIITLPNQLEILLIHDATTDKASAALDVNVGSFSDAEDMPGIAHAVEHLLFMGTEKVSLPRPLTQALEVKIWSCLRYMYLNYVMVYRFSITRLIFTLSIPKKMLITST
jgi:hypothetical protein